MGFAVFKTDVGREERPGCVRFARASAKRILECEKDGMTSVVSSFSRLPARYGWLLE